MLSRGALGLASPRVRRGFALSWSALFILSLLLQYATFALAPAALAVHDDGLFELDGNALSSGAVAGDDWDKVNGGTSAADATSGLITDLTNSNSDDIFTGGGSKDEHDTTDWLWTKSKPQAKNDIAHVYAAAYTSKAGDTAGDTIVYFGLDKYDASGDNFVGFWFLQGQVGPTGNGNPPGSPFSGSHKVGDVLVLADYTNGGGVSAFSVFKWVASGGDVSTHLDTVATGVPCTGAPATDVACATTNTDTEDAPWSFEDKSGSSDFLAGEFFEGGINLTALGLDTGCFTSFIGETRSSQSTDATLSDFAGGQFSFCQPPTIATQVQQDGQSLGSVGTINVGDSVTDHATFSGSKGAVTGTADFFLCFNASSTPNCATGGTPAGSDTISGGAADSDPVAPTQVGFYCFRVEFTPVEGSKYLAASHTNQTTECFQVLPANVTISKTADVGPFSAGDQIGFTLSWGNSGAGKATGVVVTDNLPAGGDLDWSIAGSTGTGSTCSISGAVGSEVLTCNIGSINGNTAVSGTVHVVSGTTAVDCATINNTGSIVSGNDGSGSANASLVVNCPDILVQKTAAASQIRVGDTASFTITVSNIGAGIARNVVLTDPLPGGLTWTIDPAVSGCSITSGTLTCNLGDMDPADSVSITVTADTDGLAVEGGSCTNLLNTASATAANEGSGTVLQNNHASADIDVCESVLTITKAVTDVNDAAPVNDPDLGVPGTKIGDVVTFTLHYTGGGLLENAFIVDVLPIGEDYVGGTASSNADFDFTSATLSGGQWTLRWDATGTLPDPASGDLTYDVKVLAAAAEQAQPLTNTVTIDSDQTNPDSDTAAIAVAPPPEALTPPPTDVFTPATGTSNPGFTLMLILIGIAAATLGIGFVTPVPARARRRDRRG